MSGQDDSQLCSPLHSSKAILGINWEIPGMAVARCVRCGWFRIVEKTASADQRVVSGEQRDE